MIDGGPVWHWRSVWLWICIDDLVTALFAFADDRCDLAEDAFTLGGALFIVAVEDFGLDGQPALFGP